MRTITAFTLAACSIAIFSTPAAAKTEAETVSIEIPYGDLNLATAAGMETLNGRISAAAKRICGRANLRNFVDTADHGQCMQETHRSARVFIARITGNRAVLSLNTARGSR